MGKKTIIPIEFPQYKFKEGTITATGGGKPTLSFDDKIIQILIRYTDRNGYIGDMFYYNPNSKFWRSNIVNASNIVMPFKGYIYNSSYSIIVRPLSEYSVELYNTINGATTIDYIALLEDNAGNASVYLLNGTILYTDGTVTSDVSGAIQTLETNKYKIKANALVTITGATYANISN